MGSYMALHSEVLLRFGLVDVSKHGKDEARLTVCSHILERPETTRWCMIGR